MGRVGGQAPVVIKERFSKSFLSRGVGENFMNNGRFCCVFPGKFCDERFCDNFLLLCVCVWFITPETLGRKHIRRSH